MGEVLMSWGAVYVALFLPAVLMLVNFVFGKCFVSEALSRAQHAPQSLHTRARIVGRAHIAFVVLSFIWQYYVVMFVARPHVSGSDDVHACNPVVFVWDVVDALPRFGAARVGLLLQCLPSDVFYLTSVTLFAFLYVSCVFSVPQLSRGGLMPEDGDAGTTAGAVSHCRKCEADILQADHHCYFICNCVGRRNKQRFLLCLLAGIVNLSYLLYEYLVWVLREGDALTNLGALLVVAFDAFLAALLGFQLLLWRRGWSTKDFLKVRARYSESLLASAKRLLL